MRLVLQASGLGMLYLLLGVTAALGDVAPAAVVAAALAVAELLVTVLRPEVAQLMDSLQLGSTLRMLARDGLLLLLVIRVGGAPADQGLAATS